jgi:hypothetical protein
MRRIVSLLIFSIVIAANGWSQRVESVCGEYRYVVPETESMAQAKQTSLQKARLQAIADKFGTTITQSNSTFMKNENGSSSSQFYSIGSSDVNGEWIADDGEPKYEMALDKDVLVVSCRICGKARELKHAKTEFKAALLRNGTDDKFEDTSFHNGDDVYLSFITPANGYVAVYLVDESPKAYCLLPYQNDEDGQQPVRRGERHVFFSSHDATASPQSVDEFKITCEKSRERNQVYIIFSPNPFTKALDMQQSSILPRELDYKSFQQWLGNCRKKDKDMQVMIKDIDIEK